MNKGLKIAAIVLGVGLAGFVGFRIYKYYQFRSGNPQKDNRKINIEN
jgi:hypothetical protein